MAAGEGGTEGGRDGRTEKDQRVCVRGGSVVREGREARCCGGVMERRRKNVMEGDRWRGGRGRGC